jgi:hypothetical protein
LFCTFVVSDLLKVLANQIPNFCKPRDVGGNLKKQLTSTSEVSKTLSQKIK